MISRRLQKPRLGDVLQAMLLAARHPDEKTSSDP